MAETESLKVYELAKQLDTDSISLLDRLSDLGIQVKSHMSSLSPDQVQTALDALKPKSKAKAKTKKKVVRKKKATADTSPSEEVVGTAAKSGSKKIIKRAVRKKPAAAAVEAESESPATKAAPVLRRRAGAPGSDVAGSLKKERGPMLTASALDPAPSPVRNAEYAPEVIEKESSAPAPEASSTEHAVASESSVQVAPATDRAPVAPAPEAVPEAPVIRRKRAPAPKSFLKNTNLDPQKSGLRIEAMPNPEAERKAQERDSRRPGPGPRGRGGPGGRGGMLNAMDPAKGGGPGDPMGAGDTTSKKPNRIVKVTKESMDRMAEEEAAKKRSPGGGRERTLKPEDVRFADYRKKELVFLPKRKKIPANRELKKTQVTKPAAHKRIIEIDGGISVQDLANQMGIKATIIIKKLMGMGQMATIHQMLDMDTAALIATEFDFETKSVSFDEDSILQRGEDTEENMVSRPPVVTVMGHVDHGKTSLLDAIKETNVVSKEAGGITQHIGAYTIEKNGKLITFIDTPGHEAFTVMRARGANATDIVVLVVAADDGVMPQTREAVSHAQAAEVPIIVAMNKMDKAGANPEKIKQSLSELNLLAEDWGGQTMYVPVSAIEGTGIPEMLEAINLNAELLELKANATAKAEGVVLEARLEKGRGPVVSVLVKRGTLRRGDSLVAGTTVGKVRALTNHLGQQVKEVTPGMAAEILGFEGVPGAGETFNVTANEIDARKLADYRSDSQKAAALAKKDKVSLEDIFAKVEAGKIKELKVILKADVYGSAEAVKESLEKVSTDKVKVNVILSATGGVSESDVMLASASNAIIVGFNVRPETKARRIAENEGIEIKNYNIIYELIDDIKKAMAGLLDKKKVEKFLGRAEVRQVFNVPKAGQVAGSAVVDGKMIRGAEVRLLRDSRIIFEGKMASLRRFKEDAKEVATGYECGIGLENFNDIKNGDIIEAFEIEMVSQEL